MGFVAAGVPLGVTMSFLIASPMVDEVAIVLLFGLFGWQITGLYIASGLTIAVVAGMVLGRLRLEHWVEPFVFETKLRGKQIDPSQGMTWDDRLQIAREEVVSILRKVWPDLLVGIGVGAAIHGWAPEDFFTQHATGMLGVPLAVLIGVPLYSNAAGVLALVEVLHDKGLPTGHGAGVHDERRRALATRDDPPPARAQAAAHRHLRRRRRQRDPRDRSALQPDPLTRTLHRKAPPMDIKILGTGCVNCKNLETNTRAALDALGLGADIDKVTDPGEIIAWGVMSTPALVIDDEVVLSGRVPPVDQLRQLLTSR
jgi:small redox-active disulfide protein 2